MADIQLSAQLFQDIQQAVERQQPGADQGVTLQYLAAVTGYLLGSQTHLNEQQRGEFMDELCGFARHVADDVGARQRQQQETARAKAFGYWEPPKS
ncbi:MAG: hypothetical protein RLZ44_1145 [Pseudomonadota bacterium]